MEEISAAEKIDARWFKRFETLFFDDYEKLSGDMEVREREKADFLKGDKENPCLDYPELETFDPEGREAELLDLKKDVLALEQNDAVRKIYRTKINESLAAVRMLRAAKSGDDRKFSRYADFIYGRPEQADTNYIVSHVKDLIGENILSSNEHKRTAALRLKQELSSVEALPDHGIPKSILPEKKTDTDVVKDIEEAVAAFEAALKEIGANDWAIEVDDQKGISNFSVSQEHKLVRIPSEEKLLKREVTKTKLKGLIEHEIKTHVARRHNGERSKLQLLGLGLDRYLKAEEGIATYAEQQITGAKDFAGIPLFLSIALAKGLGGEKRDFRKTHATMADYRMLSSDKDIAPERAAELAYNDCVRIFRGTTCKTKGAIYPKDLSYFAGNRATWTLVAKDFDVVQTFTIGKYDPNNSEHIALLTKLGIFDGDLEVLEEGG